MSEGKENGKGKWRAMKREQDSLFRLSNPLNFQAKRNWLLNRWRFLLLHGGRKESRLIDLTCPPALVLCFSMWIQSRVALLREQSTFHHQTGRASVGGTLH